MHGAMFHMKHPQGQAWQGSSGGLARAGAGLALAIGLLGAGCSSPEDMAGATASAEAAASTGSEAVAFADNAEKDGGKREFAYAWPAEVSAIPALAESLPTGHWQVRNPTGTRRLPNSRARIVRGASR